MPYPTSISLRPGYPDFLDLPWDIPLNEWSGRCSRLEEVTRGLSRHPVVFVNYDGQLYALKELHAGSAEKEYETLRHIEDLHLPAVIPVGHADTQTSSGSFSVLITRFLDNSLPFRTLFMRPSLERYRQNLLDAIAGLLVQLHLSGVYWGDCSLSNTLFRRDAGALQAYLVDAETSEIHSGYFPPTYRFHDLQIMEENISTELVDLEIEGDWSSFHAGVPLYQSGASIRVRYQRLWEEITHEDIINPGEHFRIQERIRALNNLGFSVRDVELATSPEGNQLRLRVVVTDRNFHSDQLYNLTGLDVEEMQARKLMNEVQEIRATLSRDSDRSVPLSAAAYHWLTKVYMPVVEKLQPLVQGDTTLAELYCQVLEHKWYLSERAQRDVGHQTAVEDYLVKFQ